MASPQPLSTPGLRQMPASIWVLGFVSLLMDISSEMIHCLLPLFLVGPLGASVALVGLIEGLAEATPLIAKLVSGAVSDYVGRRKPLALLGYGVAALSKPLFAVATGPGLVFGARMLDRLGKGLRGAPRDALLAEHAPPGQRGAAFGLRQSLDTVGAFSGPLAATALMLVWADDFRAVFAVAALPAFAAVALLAVGVHEPAPTASRPRVNPLSRANLARLPAAYWWVVALGASFTLARFSEAFLVLRAQQTGVATALVPVVLVAMNLVYAASAYPFGNLGMTQGLLGAMVAAATPNDLRGTAYGFFGLVSGVATLLASVIAGLMWTHHGASATLPSGVHSPCSL